MTKNAAFLSAYRAGNYEQALRICLKFLREQPSNANALADAAVCYLRMDQHDNAVTYALQAVALDPLNLAALDTISHAGGVLKRWQEISFYGLKALEVRDKQFGAAAPGKRPLTVKSGGASRKIISFSLFGANPKYCEPAVLNVTEQPQLYPGWTCRFHVDETVPDFIRRRLERAGAEIIHVDANMKRWPHPMWRFAAYDDPDVERVIFRDADSVISAREAGAVQEWIESGRQFHVMRDGPSHTELMLAGLWGVVAGGLPRMADLVADFLKRPVESSHFADQHFLREFVWPLARQNMLQHDSLFGFLEHRPFPEGPHRANFHVGACESASLLRANVSAADGVQVQWRLVRPDTTPPEVICAYPAVVRNKQIEAHVPMRYAVRLQRGELRAHIDPLPN